MLSVFKLERHCGAFGRIVLYTPRVEHKELNGWLRQIEIQFHGHPLAITRDIYIYIYIEREREKEREREREKERERKREST
jgi:hypothetical protein